jgi:hypothetical protein
MATDWSTVAEYVKALPACVEPANFSDPHVSTPPAPDDGIAAYRAAHPDAYRTGPGEPAGPGAPTATTEVKTTKAGSDYFYLPSSTPPQYL